MYQMALPHSPQGVEGFPPTVSGVRANPRPQHCQRWRARLSPSGERISPSHSLSLGQGPRGRRTTPTAGRGHPRAAVGNSDVIPAWRELSPAGQEAFGRCGCPGGRWSRAGVRGAAGSFQTPPELLSPRTVVTPSGSVTPPAPSELLLRPLLPGRLSGLPRQV